MAFRFDIRFQHREGEEGWRLSRGILRSQTRACGPWRDGETALRLRSWSSCGCETRGSSSGCDDSVEMCASALKCAPKKFLNEIWVPFTEQKILSAAIPKYISSSPEPQKTRFRTAFTQRVVSFSQAMVQLELIDTICIESKGFKRDEMCYYRLRSLEIFLHVLPHSTDRIVRA
jgi:hypothetical protein